MIYVFIAAVAAGGAGYYIGKRSQKHLKAKHIDLLEQIIFSLRACGDNLLINPDSQTTRKQFIKLRELSEKVVSAPNKKLK